MSSPEPVTQSMIRLPHLGVRVPLLTVRDDVRYLPLFPLCRMLGVDADDPIRRRRHTMLWYEAKLLPLWWREKEIVAWSLPYVSAISSFLGDLVPLARTAELRQRAHEEVEAASKVMEWAWMTVQERFEDARRSVYQLATLATELETLADTATAQGEQLSIEQRERLDAVLLVARAALDQTQAFVREWSADKGTLPVVDTLSVNESGDVVEARPMTLFGVAKEEDLATIAQCAAACARARKALLAALAN